MTAMLIPPPSIAANGRPLTAVWAPLPEILGERQSLRFTLRYDSPFVPGDAAGACLDVSLRSLYHETFLNVYEGASLTQAIPIVGARRSRTSPERARGFGR